MALFELYKKCRDREAAFLPTLFGYGWRRLQGVYLLAHPRTVIRGMHNIKTSGLLQVGLSSPDFVHRYDHTLLAIRGTFEVLGNCHIGRGCRIDVSPKASFQLGDQTYLHPFCKIIASQGIEIGSGCAISWEVSLIDDDFHSIDYPGKKQGSPTGIRIGNNVWIGAGATLLAGTRIADGCVVAANSTVRGEFLEKNCLIAGHPAEVIRKDITWS